MQVLGSLSFEQGTDGRLAFIGYRNQEEEGVRKRGDSFRCALEVAWDMAAGGVFVRQFSMESEEKSPRLVMFSSEYIHFLLYAVLPDVSQVCFGRLGDSLGTAVEIGLRQFFRCGIDGA